MTWLRPVDRTSGTLTLSAGTLSCLASSWNAPFEALPHNDRAGTHDSADGQFKAYACIGRGQAQTTIFGRYPQSAASLLCWRRRAWSLFLWARGEEPRLNVRAYLYRTLRLQQQA
jgi:hypothetical protein